MAQYINKDALVVEIEKRKAINEKSYIQTFLNSNDNRDYFGYKVQEDIDILSFIDTLEVKEVDFEKELDRIWFDNRLGNYFDNDAMDFTHIRTLCKHFFELGLKAQKGE